MRVLIGVDGSSGSEAALSELRRAGMPQDVEALVLSVADVLLPGLGENDLPETGRVAAEVRKAQSRAAAAVEEARATALRAKQTLEPLFPGWHIDAEAAADSPGWGVVKKAEEWKADLVVVGSHNRSALSRLFLGSVAQTVMHHAHTSVHISRPAVRAADSHVRLVAGVDGSAGAEAVVSAIAKRSWPEGTTLHLVTAIDALVESAAAGSAGGEHPRDWMEEIHERSADKLRAAGLEVSSIILDGDPRRVLVQEAERLEADCIFVGARGLRGIARILLGSVSSAVAATAHCSVEVVRT